MLRFEYARRRKADSNIQSKIEYVDRAIALYQGVIAFQSQGREEENYQESFQVKKFCAEQDKDPVHETVRFRSTVTIERKDGTGVDYDISQYVQGFDPLIFLYMNRIFEIDISGCNNIDVVQFMDCVVFCQNAEVLKMRSCTQFRDLHFMQMLLKMPNLSYVDLDNCQEISFAAAYWVISSLHKLRMIAFQPANAQSEKKDWKRLYHLFFNVKFGVAFTSILPYYGSYVRLPEGYCEE